MIFILVRKNGQTKYKVSGHSISYSSSKLYMYFAWRKAHRHVNDFVFYFVHEISVHKWVDVWILSIVGGENLSLFVRFCILKRLNICNEYSLSLSHFVAEMNMGGKMRLRWDTRWRQLVAAVGRINFMNLCEWYLYSVWPTRYAKGQEFASQYKYNNFSNAS